MEGTDLPLAGVRVLEVGGGIAAAFATRWLAGFGADVVRADLEVRVPLTAEEAVYLLAGKRRVAVGRDELARLAAVADIVVEDREPGEVAELGLDLAALRAERPEVVVVSITPFGQAGPYAGYQATNIVTFAMGGIMSVTGDPDRPPLVTGGSQAQYLGGLNGAGAAATAYLGRLVHGEGDWVDISQQECLVSNMELYASGTSYGDPVQVRMGNQVRPVWAIYPCGEERWAGVFCLQRQIRSLFAVLDDPELDDDPRYEDPLQRDEVRDELTAKLYTFFAEHGPGEILELGRRHKVPFGVAMTPGDLLAAEGLAARGYFEVVATPQGEVTVPGRPFPGLPWRSGELHEAGADTDTVLAGWGVA
jgi:crotonobetainyl-CoA:carnitine CoA-transferase CaiB-like acyl-CoA transferase